MPDPQPISNHRPPIHCDCGQPARWTLYLPSGRFGHPTAYHLCDRCLTLELTKDDPCPPTIATTTP